MLRRLGLTAFKCFERLDLRLAPLTLLSGQNSGGKSSVIQALVLLGQTLEEREWGNALALNGPDVSLGAASDVINQSVGGRELRMTLATDTEEVSWLFGASDRRAMSLDLQGVDVDGRPRPVTAPLRWLQPADIADRSPVVAALRRLSWLSAERTGPREILPLLDPEHHTRVGARGELAAGLLHWRGDERVEPDLCLSGEIPTLFHQVRAWMRRFFPGVDFRLSPVEGTNAITLQMRSNAKADFQRPQNVGFGLSQLFPVIVALMAARPGDTVVVENPEARFDAWPAGFFDQYDAALSELL